MFSLKLFGGVSLQRDGVPLSGPAAQRRRLALLALLAAGAEGGTSRDKLIGLLWPDTDSDQARRFIADSVYSLRKVLGEDAILAEGGNLRLNAAIVWSDVVEFRRALGRGDWEAAAGLCDGPFLDGFFVPDGAELERWADAERAALGREYSAALERLARQAEADAEHAVAAAWWQRLQVADPLNSRIALNLVTALEASGDRAAALRHVQVHETMLREELGIAVGPDLAAFADRVKAAAAVPPTVTPPAAAAGASGPSPDASPGRGAARADVSPGAEFTSSSSGAAPSAVSAPAPGQPILRARGPRHARTSWSVAAILVVVLVVIAARELREPRAQPERVLVAAFDNNTGDPRLEPIRRVAADWIARGLLHTGSLEVVSPTWMNARGDTAGSVRSMAARARAGTLVTGAFYLDGDMLRFEAQVTDPVRGRLLHALEPVSVPADSSTVAVELLRQRVAATLAARFVGSQELREITRRAQPPTFAAYSAYVEGVQLFSRFQTAQAATQFELAWSLDSTFHVARLYSVLVAYNTGNTVRGDSLVRALLLRRDRMDAFERSLLDSFAAEMIGDRGAVLRAVRRVAEVTPGSQFAVGHAVAAVAANRPREALDALLELDPSVGLLRDNPRYWDWLTVARHLLGQHRRELRHARSGRAHQSESLEAHTQEVRALAALGRVDELERLLDEMLTLTARSHTTPADVMRLAAAELRSHGHGATGDAGAARILDRALAWYDARPAAERPRHRGDVARTLYARGRHAEARALFEQLALEQPGSITVLGHLGTLAARRGDRTEAERISAALAALRPSRGAQTVWRARIAAQLGDRDRALHLLREAFSQGVSHGMWLHTDADLSPLRDDHEFRRLTRPVT